MLAGADVQTEAWGASSGSREAPSRCLWCISELGGPPPFLRGTYTCQPRSCPAECRTGQGAAHLHFHPVPTGHVPLDLVPLALPSPWRPGLPLHSRPLCSPHSAACWDLPRASLSVPVSVSVPPPLLVFLLYPVFMESPNPGSPPSDSVVPSRPSPSPAGFLWWQLLSSPVFPRCTLTQCPDGAKTHVCTSFIFTCASPEPLPPGPLLTCWP